MLSSYYAMLPRSPMISVNTLHVDKIDYDHGKVVSSPVCLNIFDAEFLSPRPLANLILCVS